MVLQTLTAVEMAEKTLVNNPGKVKSSVWHHFGFWKEKGEDGRPFINKKIVVCKICKYELKYNTNTTNLSAHLRSKHKEDYEQIEKPKTDVPTLFQNVQKLQFNSVRATTISQVIGEYIVADMCPLSTVERPGFRHMVGVLEPRYTVPSRKYFTETLLPKMYSTAVENVKSNLMGVEDVAITHDIWTSIYTESYGTVTCHFLNKDWGLCGFVLSTRKVPGQHTGEAIAEDLENVRVEWNLPKPTAVTDNAANECKAIRQLEWLHISCMGHNINLAVRAALGISEPAKITGRGRSLVSFFHKSPLATEILLQKQKGVLPEESVGHRLIQDVATRWNSTLDMLERLLEQTAAIHAAVLDPVLKKQSANIQSKLFSFAEQQLAESMVALLKPMKEATILLSQDKVPTLPLVLPTMAKLERMLSPIEEDSVVIAKMKKLMWDNLSLRNVKPLVKKALCISSFLDPRLKDLAFISEEERADTHVQIVDYAVALPGPVIVVKTEPTENTTEPPLPELPVLPSTSQVKTDSEEPVAAKRTCFLDDVIITSVETPPTMLPHEKAVLELQRYQSEPVLPFEEDPMLWWRQRAICYPLLSRLAKKYLSIPASSTPAERVFSTAGNIVTKKRARLGADNIDMLIFLNKNHVLRK